MLGGNCTIPEYPPVSGRFSRPCENYNSIPPTVELDNYLTKIIPFLIFRHFFVKAEPCQTAFSPLPAAETVSRGGLEVFLIYMYYMM